MFAVILWSPHVFSGSKHQAAGDQGRPGEGCGAPGAREARWFCNTVCAHSNESLCVSFVDFVTCPCSSSALPVLRRGSEAVEKDPASVRTDPRRDTSAAGGAGGCYSQSIRYNG